MTKKEEALLYETAYIPIITDQRVSGKENPNLNQGKVEKKKLLHREKFSRYPEFNS